MYAIVFNNFWSEENKTEEKKSKRRPTVKKKVTNRSQLDTKCQEFGYGHFVLQLDTHILCSFPSNKQSNNKHRQLKQISQECEACTASTESATKTTQKTAETMKHTQAGSTKLKAVAKPKQKHAQQESFQTPQQIQLN
jgi:FtsZ-interacting cell division protein ZipA